MVTNARTLHDMIPQTGTPQSERTAPVVRPSDSIHWGSRGVLVGLVYGTAAGSVFPVTGNVVGAVVGVVVGMCFGLLMAGIAAVTRHLLPVSHGETETRERRMVIILLVVASLVIAFRFGGPLVSLPALPGIIHSVIAGTPTRDLPYSGDVSPRRRRLLKHIPLVVALVMVCAFAYFVIPH
jgi:hypothetical protein